MVGSMTSGGFMFCSADYDPIKLVSILLITLYKVYDSWPIDCYVSFFFNLESY